MPPSDATKTAKLNADATKSPTKQLQILSPFRLGNINANRALMFIRAHRLQRSSQQQLISTTRVAPHGNDMLHITWFRRLVKNTHHTLKTLQLEHSKRVRLQTFWNLLQLRAAFLPCLACNALVHRVCLPHRSHCCLNCAVLVLADKSFEEVLQGCSLHDGLAVCILRCIHPEQNTNKLLVLFVQAWLRSVQARPRSAGLASLTGIPAPLLRACRRSASRCGLGRGRLLLASGARPCFSPGFDTTLHALSTWSSSRTGSLRRGYWPVCPNFRCDLSTFLGRQHRHYLFFICSFPVRSPSYLGQSHRRHRWSRRRCSVQLQLRRRQRGSCRQGCRQLPWRHWL